MMNCSVNPSTMTVHWKGSIPEFRVTGQYKLSGQLFALKLDGQGPFWTILSSYFPFLTLVHCNFNCTV